VDRDFVTVTDPADLAAICAAIVAARPQPVDSYPGMTCDLEFVFGDGRAVKMLMSPTGITARNFFGQDVTSFTPPNYVTLRAGDKLRITDGQPFNDVLRRQGLIAATQPAANSTPAAER
jgi:hypothetical protein